MTDQNLSHIYFLLDRSGSMASIRNETISGFDAFIAEQRKAPGACQVTLAQFDDEYDEVYTDLPLAAVPALDLSPRGCTALLDALGRLIVTSGERLAKLPESARPGSVIVGVMTDGYENASEDWTHARIKALIEQQTRDYAWEFLYLGADQDAIEEGAKMGFAGSKSVTYRRGKADKVMADLGANVGAYRAARVAGAPAAVAAAMTEFTQAQRDDAVN
ncbi:MAG TPA: vWA domain-containing protein [Nocardioidaceae bacterium]|nr:vWA domain-containing protein [Nocardioidaceae bacterium]